MTDMTTSNLITTDRPGGNGGPQGPVSSPQLQTAPMHSLSDVENRLHEELSHDRIINLRADAAEQFVNEAALPQLGDRLIPGYRMIREGLAREVGLTAIPDDPFDDLPPEQPQPPSGLVVGNLVASFLDGVTGINKQDVADTALFAQLVANGKANRAADPVGWTSAYSASLERLAWIVPSYRFVTLSSSGSQFSIDQAILHILKGVLTGDALENMKTAIDAVKSLSSQDRRFVIFERNSHTGGAGNFQVDSVGQTAGGQPQMTFSGYNFRSTDTVTNVLWFRFSSNSTTFNATRTTALLNSAVYARVRDAVQNRLVQYVGDYVGAVPFGDM
jgi:hypothetical protein